MTILNKYLLVKMLIKNVNVRHEFLCEIKLVVMQLHEMNDFLNTTVIGSMEQ